MPGTFGFQKGLKVLSNKVFRFIQQALTIINKKAIALYKYSAIAPNLRLQLLLDLPVFY